MGSEWTLLGEWRLEALRAISLLRTADSPREGIREIGDRDSSHFIQDLLSQLLAPDHLFARTR